MSRLLLGTLLLSFLLGSTLDAAPPRFDPDLPDDPFFPPGNLEGGGIDEEALERLLEESDANHTDALLILKDGRVVCERYSQHGRGPISLMSVTKLFSWAGIGLLIDQGKIASVDTALSTWFPKWGRGTKARVTLRHILNHTSGLQHRRSAMELNRQRDRVLFARRSKIFADPGDEFSYNNRAIALLAGIAREAGGEPLDELVGRELLHPIASSGHWQRDRSGSPIAYAELSLRTRDVAKFGQLILQGGRFGTRQLISSSWISSSSEPGENPVGLIWFHRRNRETGETIGGGIYHTGWLGQYLMVYPEWGLVGVRLTHGVWGESGLDEQASSFPSFPALLEDCVLPRGKKPYRPTETPPPFLRNEKPTSDGLEEPSPYLTGKATSPLDRILGAWELNLDRGTYRPSQVRGRLRIHREPDGGVSGRLSLFDLTGWIDLPLETIRTDGTRFSFRALNSWFDTFIELRGKLEASHLRGLCRMGNATVTEFGRPNFPWSFEARSADSTPPPRFESPSSPSSGLPSRDLEKQLGLRSRTLDLLIEGAHATDSTDLLVLKDDLDVCRRTFGRETGPRPLHSLTRVLSWLVVGKLLEDGSLPSWDAPLHRWIPELRGDPDREAIHLGHVLGLTTGLQLPRKKATQVRDHLSTTLTARSAHPPGTATDSNWIPYSLLSRVVRESTGVEFLEFVERSLFKPLEISEWQWQKDEAGTPLLYDGLSLLPRDVAKVGQLILAQGRWKHRQLASQLWLETSGPRASSVFGTSGRVWNPMQGSVENTDFGHATSIKGTQGQYLIVAPDWNLVIVRMNEDDSPPSAERQWQAGFDAIYSIIPLLVELP